MARRQLHYDLYYNGQRLQWWAKGTFRATSGMPGMQHPRLQCDPRGGPLPEGSYFFRLREDGAPARAGSNCTLLPAWYLQTIPRDAVAGTCEQYWINWGRNRVRLMPADRETARACQPRRGGFYLHDSTKGYSHGCIEVEGRFFDVLRQEVAAVLRQRSRSADKLMLLVRYNAGMTTNGGTGAL